MNQNTMKVLFGIEKSLMTISVIAFVFILALNFISCHNPLLSGEIEIFESNERCAVNIPHEITSYCDIDCINEIPENGELEIIENENNEIINNENSIIENEIPENEGNENEEAIEEENENPINLTWEYKLSLINDYYLISLLDDSNLNMDGVYAVNLNMTRNIGIENFMLLKVTGKELLFFQKINAFENDDRGLDGYRLITRAYIGKRKSDYVYNIIFWESNSDGTSNNVHAGNPKTWYYSLYDADINTLIKYQFSNNAVMKEATISNIESLQIRLPSAAEHKTGAGYVTTDMFSTWNIPNCELPNSGGNSARNFVKIDTIPDWINNY